jgi:type VI secretion system protein ImpK
MSTPDPFAAFESERTIIKPKPRAGASAAMTSNSPPPPGAAPDAAPPVPLGDIALLNPLVSCASRLLMLAGKLRHLARTPDAASLRASAAQAVQQFDATARQAGIGNETVVAARYVLCTAIDEAVANTPWGVSAGWNKQSLLVQFHNETWGGEKVFQLLGRLSQDAATHRALLELIYCVLALGFEGRFRVVENGRAQLDGVRARLAELIRKNRPALELGLSPHWRGDAGGAMRLRDTLPMWLVASVFALVLALSWFGLRLWLNYRSDALYGDIAALRVPNPPPVAPPAAAPVPRLERFLSPEIKAGLVTVTDEIDRSTVRLRGDSLFGSGSADPTSTSLPLLRRIGEALGQVKGQVLITGHSDNQPIRSLRYPSNWDLSNARAQAVMSALTAQVEPARMHAEGKADAEPVALNDSPANRARNRRVEIVLVTGSGS